MRFILSTIVATLFVAGTAAATGVSSPANSDVVRLTSDNFKKWTAAQDLALVDFYVPWCGHCKRLAPNYEKAATALKKDNVPLAKINCKKERPVCRELGISRFPTMKVIKNGSFANYNGTRQDTGIISYMRKHRFALQTVSADTFSKFRKSSRVVVVGFVDKTESSEFKVLEAFTKEHHDGYTFGVVVADKKLAEKHGISATPGAIVFKDFGKAKAVFDGAITPNILRKFIKDFEDDKIVAGYKPKRTSSANILALTSAQFNGVIFDKSKDVFINFHLPWYKQSEAALPDYDRLGKILSANKNLVIAHLDLSKNEIPSNAPPSLRPTDYPAFILVRGEDNRIVECHEKRTVRSLVEFLEKNAANKISYNIGDLVEENETKPKILDIAYSIQNSTPLSDSNDNNDNNHVEL
ncbi:protein disulfide-isomerase precursor [Dipsacomyces acuminosporus]|nr:protein disulfide-isomerase precursor [Dipsacomyces acuminosporus]